MIAEAIKYEELLESRAAGSFGKIEYENENKVLLRTSSVKTADLSGTVRLYFNNQREQRMVGRRFDPMPSGLILMRPGAFYRVYTIIEIVKPIPEGVSALVVLNSDTSDVMMVTTAPFYTGFIGLISFTVQPYRRIEIEKMTSLASLMFFEASVTDERLKEVKSEVLKGVNVAVKKAIKNGNSDRTKKLPALAKEGTKSKAKPPSKAVVDHPKPE